MSRILSKRIFHLLQRVQEAVVEIRPRQASGVLTGSYSSTNYCGPARLLSQLPGFCTEALPQPPVQDVKGTALVRGVSTAQENENVTDLGKEEHAASEEGQAEELLVSTSSASPGQATSHAEHSPAAREFKELHQHESGMQEAVNVEGKSPKNHVAMDEGDAGERGSEGQSPDSASTSSQAPARAKPYTVQAYVSEEPFRFVWPGKMDAWAVASLADEAKCGGEGQRSLAGFMQRFIMTCERRGMRGCDASLSPPVAWQQPGEPVEQVMQRAVASAEEYFGTKPKLLFVLLEEYGQSYTDVKQVKSVGIPSQCFIAGRAGIGAPPGRYLFHYRLNLAEQANIKLCKFQESAALEALASEGHSGSSEAAELGPRGEPADWRALAELLRRPRLREGELMGALALLLRSVVGRPERDRVRLRDSAMVRRVGLAAAALLPALAPYDAVNVAWGLAKLGAADAAPSSADARSLFGALNGLLYKVMDHLNPEPLSRLLWAYAELRQQPPRRLVKSLAEDFVPKPDQLSPRSLALSLWALADLKYRPSQTTLEELAAAAAAKAAQQRPEDLPLILDSLFRLGLRGPSAAVSEVASAAASRASQLLAGELASTFHSLALLGVKPKEEQLSALTSAAEAELASFGARDLARLLWAAAKLEHGVSGRFLEAGCAALCNGLGPAGDAAGAEELGMLRFWALHELGLAKYQEVFGGADGLAAAA